MGNPVAARAFHTVCVKEFSPQDDNVRREQGYSARLSRNEDFFENRMAGRLPVEGRRVLDLGCGIGHTPVWLAQRGARHVLGVDINEGAIRFAQEKVASDFPELADRVEYRTIGDISEVEESDFDAITVKDTFEHVPDPERHVKELRARLAPGGHLAIGFGEPWRSPYGGHIKFMTKLPWAHLLFPEPVIMEERKRFAMNGRWDGATRFEDIAGGLNKMTLGRLERIMDASSLERIYLRTNVRQGRYMPLIRALAKLPFLREYLTFNVYGIWRAPGGEVTAGGDRRTP